MENSGENYSSCISKIVSLSLLRSSKPLYNRFKPRDIPRQQVKLSVSSSLHAFKISSASSLLILQKLISRQTILTHGITRVAKSALTSRFVMWHLEMSRPKSDSDQRMLILSAMFLSIIECDR